MHAIKAGNVIGMQVQHMFPYSSQVRPVTQEFFVRTSKLSIDSLLGAFNFPFTDVTGRIYR
jgi:hypothetical protein